MRILVIDDCSVHQDAAMAQLADHDVTVVGSYDEGLKLIGGKIGGKHEFEVVLVDLLMPASQHNQGPDGRRFVGQEMPVGIFLALLAAKNGAKFVAVLTDTDHHSHPASACLDPFNTHEGYLPTPFSVEGAKVLLSNNYGKTGRFRPENLAEKMGYEEGENSPSVRAKNWRELLDYLTA